MVVKGRITNHRISSSSVLSGFVSSTVRGGGGRGRRESLLYFLGLCLVHFWEGEVEEGENLLSLHTISVFPSLCPSLCRVIMGRGQ